mmetsp:Transcript_16265/g.25658  ORF Transcript_16265/g.25658 Transcript_16265/m.25658 type:complete len:154 (-) Transcript_16265:44-505(-)
MQFSQLLVHYCVVETVKYGKSTIDNAKAFSHDMFVGVVLLMNDKKELLRRLHESMRKAAQTEDEAFEMIVALMVMSVVELEEYLLIHNVVLRDADKKKIENTRSRVLRECSEKKVDERSAKLCDEFFNYSFFAQRSGGISFCRPNDDGICVFV